MITTTTHIYNNEKHEWSQSGSDVNADAQLVFILGNNDNAGSEEHYNYLTSIYPNAKVISLTTPSIFSQDIMLQSTDTLATALHFEHTEIYAAFIPLTDELNTEQLAKKTVVNIPHKDLSHILLFSAGITDGMEEIIRTLELETPANVKVTGAVTLGAPDAHKHAVGLNTPAYKQGIIIVGLYGDAISVGYDCASNLSPISPTYEITKSHNNTITTLDGESAFNVYTQYLGIDVHSLPQSGIKYPVETIRDIGDGAELYLSRMIVNADQQSGTISFAGACQQGDLLRIMYANKDKIESAATDVALGATERLSGSAQFAFIASSMARKIILAQDAYCDAKLIHRLLGNNLSIIGMHTYAEIAPAQTDDGTQAPSMLHNQSIALTTFIES